MHTNSEAALIELKLRILPQMIHTLRIKNLFTNVTFLIQIHAATVSYDGVLRPYTDMDVKFEAVI